MTIISHDIDDKKDWDKCKHTIIPYRAPSIEFGRQVDLFLLTKDEKQHFCVVNNLNRLLNAQSPGKTGMYDGRCQRKKYICRSCFYRTASEETYKMHLTLCSKLPQTMLPVKYKYETFRDHSKMVKSKVACYVDFESVLEPIENVSFLFQSEKEPKIDTPRFYYRKKASPLILAL